MKIYLVLFLMLTQFCLVKASQWPVVARDTTISQIKVSPIFYNMGRYDPVFKYIYFYPKIENNSSDTLVIERIVSHSHAKVVFAELGVGPVELPAKIAPGEFAFLSVYVDMTHYNINDIIKHEILVYTNRTREPFRINYRAELRSRYGDSIPVRRMGNPDVKYEVKREIVLTEEEKKEIQKKRESGEIESPPPSPTQEDYIERDRPFKFLFRDYSTLKPFLPLSPKNYRFIYSDIRDAYFLGIYSTLDIEANLAEESLKQNLSIKHMNPQQTRYIIVEKVRCPVYYENLVFPFYKNFGNSSYNLVKGRVLNTFSFVFKEITEEGVKYYITSTLGGVQCHSND